jgi:hypothetical protein
MQDQQSNHIIELLCSGANLKKNQNESNMKYLSRVTHCSLANRSLKTVDLHLLHNVTTLYLMDNLISDTSFISHLPALKVLYLQDNQIVKLDLTLERLEFLNARGNQIEQVILNTPKLLTLHLDNNNLVSLDLAGDGYRKPEQGSSILELEQDAEDYMPDATEPIQLQTLTVANNPLQKLILFTSNIQEINVNGTELKFNYLVEILQGSPIESIYLDIEKPFKYRQELICNCDKLESINGKSVSKFEREFTTKLSTRKIKKVSKKEVAQVQDVGDKPIPHLPPFASQYRYSLIYLRDLMLQQVEAECRKSLK